MALEPKTTPTTSAADIFGNPEQVEMSQQKTWKFAQAGADKELAKCTPVGFNDVTGEAVEWIAPDPTTILLDGGFTGGTFGLTVDGIAIAKTVLAWNATAALVESTILAATGITASVVLATGAYTITFDADVHVHTLPTVDADITSLTGGTAAKTITAGTATSGGDKIKGIVWPETITVSDSGEVQGVCMVAGKVDYDELEATVAAGDVTALKAACRVDLLPRGLNVQNLSQVR